MITRLNDDVELMSFFCTPRGGSLDVWTQMEGCCHTIDTRREGWNNEATTAVDTPRGGSDDKYL